MRNFDLIVINNFKVHICFIESRGCEGKVRFEEGFEGVVRQQPLRQKQDWFQRFVFNQFGESSEQGGVDVEIAVVAHFVFFAYDRFKDA